MNTYGLSDGTRLTRNQIETKIRRTKSLVIDGQLLSNGYNYCEECNKSSGVRLDCAHTISVKECLESGRSELAYEVRNIRMLCRECHQRQDKNCINY